MHIPRRRNLPIAALRAFEAAARTGRLTAAADELGVTHGAISRHVSGLAQFLGVALFEGPRNRPVLTAEGRAFGVALTGAFDQIDAAVGMIRIGDGDTLDVACLGTFAARWLIPRLQAFSDRHPKYSVRIATDDRSRARKSDVEIDVLPPGIVPSNECHPLFPEKLGLVVAPALLTDKVRRKGKTLDLPRLATLTRPGIWEDWSALTGADDDSRNRSPRVFDHYHLTIEAALGGLGMMIVPWHLVANEVIAGRLAAPFGFVASDYLYVARTTRAPKRKVEHFIAWLAEEAAAFPQPPET